MKKKFMKYVVLLSGLFFSRCIFPEGFIAGTPVKIASGYVPIEQIKEGDLVVSYGYDGYCYEKLVITTFQQHAEAGIKITVDGECFVAVPDQLFLLQRNEWVVASGLNVGDRLMRLGTFLAIENIEVIDGPIEIYTFTVAGLGNFFVSMHDILVHNDFVLPPDAVAVCAATPAGVAAAGTLESFVCPAIGIAVAAIPFARWAYDRYKKAHPPTRKSCYGAGGRSARDWAELKERDSQSGGSRGVSGVPLRYPAQEQGSSGIRADGSWSMHDEDRPPDPNDSRVPRSSGGGCGVPPPPDPPWETGKSGSSGRPPREKIFCKMETYEQARNKAFEVIGDVDFSTSKPIIGRVGACKGKVVGREWHNGAVTMRLDYDVVKGPHINITDYRLGKGLKGTTAAIPFKGTAKTVEVLLKHLQ